LRSTSYLDKLFGPSMPKLSGGGTALAVEIWVCLKSISLVLQTTTRSSVRVTDY